MCTLGHIGSFRVRRQTVAKFSPAELNAFSQLLGFKWAIQVLEDLPSSTPQNLACT